MQLNNQRIGKGRKGRGGGRRDVCRIKMCRPILCKENVISLTGYGVLNTALVPSRDR